MKTQATSKVQSRQVHRQTTRKTAGGAVTRRKPTLNRNGSSSNHSSPDRFSTGGGNPHQAQIDDAEKLRQMAIRGQKPQSVDTTKQPPTPPETGVDNTKQPAGTPGDKSGPFPGDDTPGGKGPGVGGGGGTGTGVGGGPETGHTTDMGTRGATPRTGGQTGVDINDIIDDHVGKEGIIDLRPDELNPDIKRDNYWHRDAPKVDDIPNKSMPDVDVDVDVDGKTLNKLRFAEAAAAFGLANNTVRVTEGFNDLTNGNYVEGGLKITANGLEGLNNANDLAAAGKNLNNYKTGVKVAEEGASAGAKTLGRFAGIAMAGYDGYQAAEAFKSGDNVKGAEHSMDAFWDVAGLTPWGTAGALAHSLTRAAMSVEIGGVSGDSLVTSGIDSRINSELNDQAAARSERDGKALSAFRGLNKNDRLVAAAGNKENFVSAMTGLQEKIGQTTNAGERARLIAELRDMKATQRYVRAYNS